MRPSTALWISACCVGWAISLPGCATWKKWEEFVAAHPDVRPERERRAREVASSYDRRRDEMQLQAAVASWKQGDAEASSELLTSLLRRSPRHREAQLLQIEIELVQENLAKARQHSETLLEQLPDDAEVVHLAATICDAVGEESEAVEHFRHAAELEPDNPVYAASYVEASEAGSATEQCSPAKAAGLRTAPTSASVASAVMLKAQVCLAFDDCQSARRLLEELLARQPQVAAAQELLREAIDPRLRPTVEAAQHGGSESWRDWRWRQIAERTHASDAPVAVPSDSEPSVAVTFVEPALQKPEPSELQDPAVDASRHNEPALVADDESLTAGAVSSQEKRSISAAVAALRQNRPELAIDLARHGLDVTPDSAGLYRTIGTAEYRRGDYAAAEEALEESLVLDNTHPLSYFLMGCTLTKLGQPDEAERFFLKARQLDSRYAKESRR